ncbi:MAG: VWA domain-containing protein [Armatimonadota bacterium]
MTGHFRLLPLFLLAALPALDLQAGTSPAVPTVRLAQPNAAAFPQVTVYAHLSDAQGQRVSGMHDGSFTVWENGTPVRIDRVETQGGVLDVCLVLDRSLSMADDRKSEYARTAASAFARELSPADRVALVTFAGESRLDHPLSGNREALLQSIEGAAPEGTTTAYLDALSFAAQQLRLAAPGVPVPARAEARRVVVALTDGLDGSSRVFADDLIQQARAQGVSLCLVALGADANVEQMDYLARNTGGVVLRAPQPQDLQALYRSLATELRQEYRLTYRSPNPAVDATRRSVRVEVPSLGLAAETWYQAPGRGSLVVTAPVGPGLSGSVTGAAGGSPPADFRRLAITMMLGVLGVVGLVAGAVLARGARGRPHRIAPATEELLPLWVRPGVVGIGRGAECDIVLDSREVSRLHAQIESEGGAYRLTDAGSRNGTYVNGKRVKGSRSIQVGDALRFGDREFRFAGDEKPLP